MSDLNLVATRAFDVHEVGVWGLHDALLLVASALGVQGRVQEVNLQRHLENPTASNLKKSDYGPDSYFEYGSVG